MKNLMDSEVLKSLGLDEKSEWMLYDDKAREFFKFIANNLDSDNVLTPDELKAYKDIEAAGNYLKGDALAEELRSLESFFPGILTVSESQIKEQERELAMLKADTATRQDRMGRMEETMKHQQRDIERFEKRRQDLEYQEKLLTQEAIEKTAQLEELQKLNLQRTKDLKQTYIEPQNPPCFMYEMPLDQHFHKCDQFLSQLDIFMRKNFNATSSPEAADEFQLGKSIIEAKKRIHEIQQKIFDDEIATASFENILREIETMNVNGDYHEMQTAIDEVERTNDELAMQLLVAEGEARKVIEQQTEDQVERVLITHLKEKNKRSLGKLDMLKAVMMQVENVTDISELLWAMIQFDIEKLKNRVDNSEELASEAQDCDKRMRLMEMISKRDPMKELQELFFQKLQDLLVGHLHVRRDEVATINDCLQELARLGENTRSLQSSFVDQENLKELQYDLKEILKQSEILREFIFCGPTNLPVLYDTKFLLPTHEKRRKQKEIEKAYDSVKTSYMRNVVEPWNNDRFFRMDKNLWIYFLTEPKMVLECIKEVQKKAAEKGTTSFKAMNITLHRPN